VHTTRTQFNTLTYRCLCAKSGRCNVECGILVWIETCKLVTTITPLPFYGPFPGPPGSAGARKELLDFMVQEEINRGRHTDHPAGCHSIWTKQCPLHHPIFLRVGCPSCRPTNSVKALKANCKFVSSPLLRRKYMVTCNEIFSWNWMLPISWFCQQNINT